MKYIVTDPTNGDVVATYEPDFGRPMGILGARWASLPGTRCKKQETHAH